MHTFNRAVRFLSVALVGLFLCSTVRALEEPAIYTDEKIKALVKQLGDEDFAKRQSADRELQKAGAKALPALKEAQASTDPQVKASANKLVGRLRLANLAHVDFLDIAPASSLLVIQFKNLGTTVENAKKSTVGKLISSAAMEPFRAKIDAALTAKPEVKKNLLLWTERFKGQIGLAIWELKLQPPEEIKLGAVFEITDTDPQAVLDDLIKQTGIFADGGAKSVLYKDVELQQNALGFGPVLGLAGKNLVFGPNFESAQKLIDGLLNATPNGIANLPEFKKARPSLGAKPEFFLAIDFQAYMKAAMSIAPMPGYEDMMKAAGMNVKYMFSTSACIGDSFEDRFVMLVEGQPQGFVAATQAPADAPSPLNEMSLIPSNAVLASVGYLDGAKLKTALSDYVAGLKKMMDNLKQQAPQPMPVQMPDFDASMKAFEAKTGLKVSDITANLKGNVGQYVVLAPGGALTPPDIGAFFTCADADKAKALIESIGKAFAAYDNKAGVKEVTAGTRTIYQLDLLTLGLALPPNFPYAPSWTMDGNRIYLASSVQALRKQLSYIDNKTPGLLTQPDFMKAMGSLSAEDRKGQMVYLDFKNLLTLGASIGLPLLQAKVTDADIKKNLAALPAPSEMLKDIPPLMMATTRQGDIQTTILHSPLPPMQSAFILGIGAGILIPAMGGMPGGPADAPPGGF